MSTDTTRPTGPLSTVVSASVRIVADLLIVALWVLFLTLLFLETGWPRLAFYALLLVGVGVYVTVTAAWSPDSRRRTDDS